MMQQSSRATVYRAPVALLHTTDRKQEQSNKVRILSYTPILMWISFVGYVHA